MQTNYKVKKVLARKNDTARDTPTSLLVDVLRTPKGGGIYKGPTLIPQTGILIETLLMKTNNGNGFLDKFLYSFNIDMPRKACIEIEKEMIKLARIVKKHRPGTSVSFVFTIDPSLEECDYATKV